MIEELASGTKYSQNLSFKMTRVSLLPSARKLPNAGFEDSHWDGPMPFIFDAVVLILEAPRHPRGPERIDDTPGRLRIRQVVAVEGHGEFDL
jgi:hypothetical protein